MKDEVDSIRPRSRCEMLQTLQLPGLATSCVYINPRSFPACDELRFSFTVPSKPSHRSQQTTSKYRPSWTKI